MGTFEFILCHGRPDFLKIVLLFWWVNSFVVMTHGQTGAAPNQNPLQNQQVDVPTDLHMVGDNPYHQRVTLDRERKYLLEWMVDLEEGRITFNVTVNTTGYIGFGLTMDGKMAGADMIIGGVGQDGQSYFSDRYAIANQMPLEDASQDWELLEASEEGGQTRMRFTRLLDTCDTEHDMPIGEDLLTVIWSYSEVDDISQYHFQNRGTYDLYLADPYFVPPNIQDIQEDHDNVNSNLSVIRLTRSVTLPPNQDTFYSCGFHKVPTSRKIHIIGFNTVFPTEQDRAHVHHIILHRCKPPPGRTNREFFEGPSRTGGSECYILDQPNPLPVPYCREVLHVWGVGGRPIFFPDHAGIPLTEEDEYLMFQVHFDNANQLPDVTVTVSIEAFYTNHIRENDVGVLQAGAFQPGPTTIMIPPSSTNHVIMGHCAPGCTSRIFGEQGGATLFAAFLHTHISGRGVRLVHNRGNQELPWALHDDNYNFNFQQFRVMKQERFVQPGDQIIHRCVYANTDRNGTATHGGFSTREEMCTAFIYYYNRSPGFAMCRGEIMSQDYNFGLLGIRNYTWNQSIRQMVIQEPLEHRGKTIGEYINTEIDWTLEFRERLQREQITQPQITQCPRFFYVDPQEQIRRQLESGVFERTGRLPGSDGAAYSSVDEDFEHESILPRNLRRWREPNQCVRRNEKSSSQGNQQSQRNNQVRNPVGGRGGDGPGGVRMTNAQTN